MFYLFFQGRLTDGHGKTIECKDAIFVMTSNLASENIASHAIQLRALAKKMTENKHANEIGKKSFREKISRFPFIRKSQNSNKIIFFSVLQISYRYATL